MCVWGGGGKTEREREMHFFFFLSELGNLLHKAKCNLLFLVIISLRYIYNPPRIVSNLCPCAVYSAYIDKLTVY